MQGVCDCEAFSVQKEDLQLSDHIHSNFPGGKEKYHFEWLSQQGSSWGILQDFLCRFLSVTSIRKLVCLGSLLYRVENTTCVCKYTLMHMCVHTHGGCSKILDARVPDLRLHWAWLCVFGVITQSLLFCDNYDGDYYKFESYNSNTHFFLVENSLPNLSLDHL